MTIIEALKASAKTRRCFCRPSSGGWNVYSEAWVYHFVAEELMADDWELWGEPMTPEEWEKNLTVARGDDE